MTAANTDRRPQAVPVMGDHDVIGAALEFVHCKALPRIRYPEVAFEKFLNLHEKHERVGGGVFHEFPAAKFGWDETLPEFHREFQDFSLEVNAPKGMG